MGQLKFRRTSIATGSALTLGLGTMAAAASMFLGAGTASACSQFIQPLNPYLDTCGIPSQGVTVPGASPSAGAIIACRHQPGCLSQVVNGPGLVSVPQTDTTVQQSQ